MVQTSMFEFGTREALLSEDIRQLDISTKGKGDYEENFENFGILE